MNDSQLNHFKKMLSLTNLNIQRCYQLTEEGKSKIINKFLGIFQFLLEKEGSSLKVLKIPSSMNS